MKDFKGNDVCAGDDVLVAMRKGSSTWLVSRKVSYIDAVDGSVHLTDGKKTYKYRGSVDALAVANRAGLHAPGIR